MTNDQIIKFNKILNDIEYDIELYGKIIKNILRNNEVKIMTDNNLIGVESEIFKGEFAKTIAKMITKKHDELVIKKHKMLNSIDMNYSLQL